MKLLSRFNDTVIRLKKDIYIENKGPVKAIDTIERILHLTKNKGAGLEILTTEEMLQG